MPRRTFIPLAGAALAVILTACSGAAGTSADPTASVDPASTVESSSGVSTTDPAAPTTPTTTTSGKISANTASEAEIAAALEAAGVPNAARWAREVAEYRPYPTDDPTLQKLQDNLAKYQPEAATLQAILSALEP
jgi:hypothetical protein